MDYLTITSGGQAYSIPYPNDFMMSKVPNKVNELQTMDGKTQWDVNGWKFAETTLKWDTLINADLNNLINALASNEFTITFYDMQGSRTVQAVLESQVWTKSCYKENGNIVWTGIEVSLSFPDCYHS